MLIYRHIYILITTQFELGNLVKRELILSVTSEESCPHICNIK